MENEFKQAVIWGTLILAFTIACYMAHVERQNALGDREFSNWIKTHHLSEFVELLFQEGIQSTDELVHFDVEGTKSFKNMPRERKVRLKKAVQQLRQQAILRTWLRTKGLNDDYIDRLKATGVENLQDLSKLSHEKLTTMTEQDHTFEDFRGFIRGISELENYRGNLQAVEKEMLSHYKSGLVPQRSYSVLTLIFMVFSTLVVIFMTFVIMLITRARNAGQMFNLSNLSKKSLLFLTGQFDIAQHTKVHWNWDEPQTVGKTMTFSVRFFHRNGRPYPVSNKDNVTVEISHAGSEVTKTMTLGGENPEEVNLASVSFTVHKSGEYTICVMFSGRHIKGSPFNKKFEAGPIDATKTGFMNYTSTVVCSPDSAYPLTIEARDSFGNLAAYKPDQHNYFKIKVTECGTNLRHVPATQIFYNARQKQLSMHIKMEKIGCYQASVSYGDVSLKNGDFNILVLNSEELGQVDKNINKSHNIWYEARLIECNNEKLQKPKKVYIYITPKQLKLKEYFLKIIGKRLFTYRVCPSTKFSFSGFSNQLSSHVFSIDDGAQAPVILAAKDRSIIAATFTKFLLRNIGGSETFQDKQTFFYHEVRTLHQKKSYSSTTLKIDRSKLLASSYRATKGFDVSDWCKSFEITFIGEEGLDWGGLRREWFESVCTELFDPVKSGLFTRLSDDSQGLVHPNCHCGGEDLKMYEFAGKIVGKCLYESARGSTYRQSYRQLVKARFSRSFLAQLIGLRVHYRYFETDDPELYKSKIRYIEENDIEGMDLTFSEEEYSSTGVVKVIDLVPNGSKIPVTNENKLQYLDHLAQYRLAGAVREQIDSFLKGLNELIPDNLLSIFDENELELLMCGMRKYSVADLKNNHIVTGNSPAFRKILEWFWTIVGSFSDEQMARLLQFTTGCSQLPPGGFAELVPKFQLSPGYTYNTLPTAHTCFNNLCLPDYDGIEQFHRSLLIALNEGNTGFGLV